MLGIYSLQYSRHSDEAMQLFVAASAQDFCVAHYQLAYHYRTGKQVQQDVKRAMVHLDLACRQNHVASILELGNYLFSNSIGIPIDKNEAFRWFRIASQFDVFAVYNLAYCFANGSGTIADPVMASCLNAIAKNPSNIPLSEVIDHRACAHSVSMKQQS
jgi:TPR repeat protein